MNTTDYQTMYDRFEEGFCQQAVSLLSAEAIQETLDQEKQRFDQAKAAGIPCPRWMGNNISRYCKDSLRRRQPGFPLYYLLGLLTEYSGFVLIWFLLRQAVSSLGGSSPFPGQARLGCSLLAIPGYLLYREVSCQLYRKQLLQGTLSHPRLIGMAVGMIPALGGAALLFFHPQGLLTTTLPPVFLAYAGLLFLSGIHNTIYSSHCLEFYQVAVSSLPLGRERTPEASCEKVQLYLSKREEQLRNQGMTQDIRGQIRQSILSCRTYCGLGAFLSFLLFAFALARLVQMPEIPLLLFTLLTLLPLVLLSGALLSCSRILGSLAQDRQRQ